jgi:hypothetical protein
MNTFIESIVEYAECSINKFGLKDNVEVKTLIVNFVIGVAQMKQYTIDQFADNAQKIADDFAEDLATREHWK